MDLLPLFVAYLVDKSRVAVLEREQSQGAGVGEGLVEGPGFSVHQRQRRVAHVMLGQI